MGSYLHIDNVEINSKEFSEIIINAIRDIDDGIMRDKKSTKKERKLFVPEYYKEIDGEKKGCGNWTIKKKGIALLLNYLKIMNGDNVWIRSMVVDNNRKYLEFSPVSDDVKQKSINRFMDDMRDGISKCIMNISSILVDMVLNKRKSVKAYWE